MLAVVAMWHLCAEAAHEEEWQSAEPRRRAHQRRHDRHLSATPCQEQSDCVRCSSRSSTSLTLLQMRSLLHYGTGQLRAYAPTTGWSRQHSETYLHDRCALHAVLLNQLLQ